MRAGLFLACIALFAGGCRAGEPAPAAASAEVAPAPGASAGAAVQGIRIVRVADMPTARAAHSATGLADGRVLIAGGCAAEGCEEGIAGDAVLFDPASGAFAPAGTLALPRAGHRALALPDGSVLLIGGWTREGATASVERYVPARARFEPAGELLQARDGFSATLLADGGVLVAGGYADGMRRLASAERFDPRSGRSEAVGMLATPRMSHTATLLADGRVLVAGGSRDARSVLASLEVFDPATARFEPAGSLARARHKHAAIALGDGVLLLGGASIPEDSGHFHDTEWWRDGAVSAGPRMGVGRYKFLDAVLAWPDGRVLVAGSGEHAEALDAQGGRFARIDAAIGAKLAFSTATALADGRVLVAGGYDPRIRPSAGAWIVTPTPAPARDSLASTD